MGIISVSCPVAGVWARCIAALLVRGDEEDVHWGRTIGSKKSVTGSEHTAVVEEGHHLPGGLPGQGSRHHAQTIPSTFSTQGHLKPRGFLAVATSGMSHVLFLI